MVDPEEYEKIISECNLTIAGISLVFGVPENSLRKWASLERKPRIRNLERMNEIMSELKNNPKMQKHPSYGYATIEQIDALQRLGLCPERDLIMKAIEKQNKMKGKLK